MLNGNAARPNDARAAARGALASLRGFTLIELVIGIAILSILLVIAIPNFTSWIRNARIRTAAESLLSGLQLARVEALKGNSPVHFQLVDSIDSSCALSASGPHWVVSRDSAVGLCAAAPADSDEETDANVPPRIIQKHDGKEGSGGKTTIAAGKSRFTFTGVGRLHSETPPANIDISDFAGGEACAKPGGTGGQARCMRIEITAAGSVRLCDPALPAADPQGCLQ